MAKKVKRARRKRNMTLPVAVIGGFMPMASYVWDGFQKGPNSGITRIGVATTGYNPSDGSWSPATLARMMGPVALGVVVHKMANKFGLNRMISATGIPLIRV